MFKSNATWWGKVFKERPTTGRPWLEAHSDMHTHTQPLISVLEIIISQISWHNLKNKSMHNCTHTALYIPRHARVGRSAQGWILLFLWVLHTSPQALSCNADQRGDWERGQLSPLKLSCGRSMVNAWEGVKVSGADWSCWPNPPGPP